MPKYLELSAIVNASSSSQMESSNLGIQKIKPYYENGELKGYVITSPKSKRDVFIGLDNEFNGDYDMPSFEKSFKIPSDPEKGYPEEYIGVLLGQVIYFRMLGDDQIEVLGQMPMIDCTWKEEKEG